MHTLLILCALLLACVSQALTIDCPSSPAKWCDSKQIAQDCDVTEQCTSFIWESRSNNDEKVDLTLYYESLCPGCQQFMDGQLYKAYESILDIVNIALIPYGNAKEIFNTTTKLYDFTCQHGPDECVGNLIHSCALYNYPLIEQYLPFIYCNEMSSGDRRRVATKCAAKTKIDFSKIDACMKSALGNQLEHQYAVQTGQLQPPHQYVPWVTVNGVHTEEIENEALTDLIGLICKTYKGVNPPVACKTHV